MKQDLLTGFQLQQSRISTATVQLGATGLAWPPRKDHITTVVTRFGCAQRPSSYTVWTRCRANSIMTSLRRLWPECMQLFDADERPLETDAPVLDDVWDFW